VLVPSTDDGSEEMVGSLGDQINVVAIEDEDKLDSFDSYDSKVSSVSKSIDSIFDSTKALRWYL
jgi:hypothetical protein